MSLVWTHSLTGAQTGVIGHGFVELTTDTTLDQDETLRLVVPATHPKAYLLSEEITLRHNGRQFYVDEYVHQRNGTRTAVEINAKALWYRLADIDYPGTLTLDNVTPRAGLASILEGDSNGWTIDETHTVGTGGFSMAQQDKSLLRLIRVWAKVTGTAAVFDTLNKTVALAATRGGTLPASFRVGRNLVAVERRRFGPKAMQLLPFGAADLGVSGVNAGSPYVENLTWYTTRGLTSDQAKANYLKRRVWVDGSFIRDVDLLPAAQAKLTRDAQSSEQVTLDVVDISTLTGFTENVSCGDVVTASDPEFEGEWTATVTRTVVDHLRPERTRIELSTSPELADDPDESSERPSLADEWAQFVGPVRGTYHIRSDGQYTVGSIPLRFRDGGRAHFGVGLTAVGVGAGTLVIQVDDTETGTTLDTINLGYTNGEIVRVVASFALEDLGGAYRFALRATTVASGGPSSTLGVNISPDMSAPMQRSSYWVMAQGAVQESPTSDTSVTYLYTGAVQSFTVPDNVVSVTVTAAAGAGGGGAVGGGWVSATMSAVPGTVYDVYVGGMGREAGFQGDVGAPGWPNGGSGGANLVNDRAAGGGGATYLVVQSGPLASARIVAGGGGGQSSGVGAGLGGAGAFLVGDSGSPGGEASQGAGGSQTAGGLGVGGGENGDTDGQGFGGDGASSTFLDYPAGGGGGGWHGGAAGGNLGNINARQGGGGGGSGFLESGATDIELGDGVNTGNGYMTISWSLPAF